MPEKVLKQVQYLCRQIADVEWSGVIFYKIDGSIKDPANMVITLEDILPLNKGTKTYTEYTFDERLIDYMMENEHLEECKIGHIHSHNTMSVYFSGTDWSELEDNAPNHNFYFSIIVNNFMDFCAKVCFIAEAKQEVFTFEAKDENGQRYEHSSGNYVVAPKLVVYDCDIESPIDDVRVDDGFMGKVKSIIEKAKTVMGLNQSTTNTNKNTVIPLSGSNWSGGNTTNQEKGNQSINQKQKEEGNNSQEERELLSFADEIEDSIEEFAMFVINTGNDISEFETVEDILSYYTDMSINGGMLAGNVAKTYIASYQKYYFLYGEELADGIMFEKATKEVIWELEHVAAHAKTRDVEKMLRPSIEVLENILKKFIEAGEDEKEKTHSKTNTTF